MENLIPRQYDNLSNFMRDKRVTVIYGPRRVGKTTLIANFIASAPHPVLSVTGDDTRTSAILSAQEKDSILAWAEGYKTIIIDEAQKIPYIGQALKILIDARPELTIIATGSASFELNTKLGEPLTGRQTPLQMFPVSLLELSQSATTFQLNERLEDFLIYGTYPEVLTATNHAEKRFILDELSSSYLLRDILEFEHVKGTKILRDLLALIAFQIGNEVSLSELASQLGIDSKTVTRYLDLFEKSFILYNVRGFSRNLRSEVTRTSKYYFYDTGVRNAIIANYNPLNMRDDVGALWENFMVMERLKTRHYLNIPGQSYFWRTWEQKEIDLIEERAGSIWAYEFKWSNKKQPKAPKQFTETYLNATFSVISPDNWQDFLLPNNKEK